MTLVLRDVPTFLGLDFESTGVDVDNDRVVTASLAYYDKAASEPWDFRDYLINPGVEIPPGATAIHGITNEAAAEGSDPSTTLPEIRDEIEKAWEQGIPLVGHNIGTYDINLLNAELERYDERPLNIRGPILDTIVLFRMLGNKKATLNVVATHYGIVNQNAHEAKSDTITSVLALVAMTKNNPYVAERTLAELWTSQRVSHRMWADGMRSFFKSKGKTFDTTSEWPVRGKWENG